MAIIEGGSGVAGTASVTDNNLNTTLPTVDSQTGKARIMSENDAGGITGTVDLKSPETGLDYRMRTGIDTILFQDQFNATAQNTNNWSYAFVTLTAAQPGAGTVNFSAVQGTTSAHGAFLRTSQTFPLQTTAPLAVDLFFGMFTAFLATNEVWLSGLGLPASAILPPTDGVWLQLTSSGLIGVISFSGTVTQTGVLLPMASLTPGTIDKFTIVIGEDAVQFWWKDEKLDEITVPAGQSTPWQGITAPVFLMKYNVGAVANTNTMRVGRVGVTLMDVNYGKPLSDIQAGQGMHATVGQNGQTMGSTAGNYSNAAPAAAGAGSNTAALVTGLGGFGQMNAQAGTSLGAGELIATSYQNPVPSTQITGRNLYITGVRISGVNLGATVATTPTTLVWGLAYGHTAVSLATTETASFATNTTRAPRRVPLGMMSAPIGAVAGQLYDPDAIWLPLQAPIVVRPGEFIASIVRFLVGTATASQVVGFTVGFNGYWE